MAGPLAVLPLGATEQHGPHLPTDVDTRVASEVARVLVAEGRDGIVLLPALAYGASGEHQDFAGTVSIGTEALQTVLVELGRSVSTWADRLLVVNGHGGNVEALAGGVALLRAEGRDAAWHACRATDDPGDTHAGHAETSLMLALDASVVRMEYAWPGCTRPLGEILPELRAGGVAAVSPTGVLGDPVDATPEEGTRLWARLHADARARVARWDPDARGMLR